MQNTSWEQTGVAEQRKRIHRTTQNSVEQGARGKTGVLVGLGLPSARGRTEAGVWSPHRGNCLSQRRNTYGWEWNSWSVVGYTEWEWDSPCCSHAFPGQGCRSSPERGSGWELEFRDCGAIPGRRLLLTAERWIEGMWGRRLWWKISVVESQAAVEEGHTAESHVGGGAITIASHSPHASIGSWTTERLARQTANVLNYRVGPHPGASLSDWCTDL